MIKLSIFDSVKAAAFNLEQVAHDNQERAEYGMYAALQLISNRKFNIITEAMLKIARDKLRILISHIKDNWEYVKYDLIRLSGLLYAATDTMYKPFPLS